MSSYQYHRCGLCDWSYVVTIEPYRLENGEFVCKECLDNSKAVA